MLRALRQVKILICVLMLLVSWLGFNLGLVAEAASNQPKTVRLAYLISPGYQEGVGPNETKQGFGYDYYQKLAYITGWRYEYVYGNFSELLAKLKAGDIDMMGNLSYTPERAKDIFYGAEEMGRESFHFYVKANNADNYANGIADFNNKIIGVNKDSYQASLLEKWVQNNKLSGAKIIYHKSKQERYNGLNTGTNDIVVSTVLSGRDEKNGDWVSLAKLGEAPFYIGISKKRPDLLAELNAAQRQIMTVEPEFNNLNYNKYMRNSGISGNFVSKTERAWLDKHPTLKVGYLSDFSPYSWVDGKGKMQGVLALVLDKFEKNYNVKTERISFGSARDLLIAAKKEQIDIMAPALGSMWRAEQDNISLTSDLMHGPMVLIFNGNYRKGLTNRIAITDCNAAGTVYAYNYLPNSKLVHFMSITEACKALEDGKADAIITQNIQYDLMRKRYPEIRPFNTMPLPNDLFIRFGTGYCPELLSLLNKNLSMISEAEVENFITKANDIPRKSTWKENLTQNIGGVAFVVITVLGLLFGGFAWYLRVAEEKNRVLTEAKDNAEQMLKKEQALRMELEEARNVANHDGLTGLWNKGSFENMLTMYQSSRNIAILVVDFDDFKNINDNYGHDVGDKVLQYVANALLDSFRTSDFVCRIGGDEFSVIMTNITSEQRDVLAGKIENIRKKLANAMKDGLPMISVSIGCAFSDRDKLKDAREIFRAADKALYTVKNSGKNNYAFYN